MEETPPKLAPNESQEDALGDLLDAFEAEWKQGKIPQIERFLSLAPGELRMVVLRELVGLDLEYRLKRKEPVTLEGYARRFPELKQTDAWPSMAATEARVRARLGLPPAAAAAQMQNARKLGTYFVLEQFPETGQGEVFLAFDPERREQVLIKQLKTNADAEARDLFTQEARVLSKLKHPALPQIYFVGRFDDRPFLAMEYIPGPQLQDWIQKNIVPPRKLARMLAPVARALHAAHLAGIIHRDVKPKNVLVDSRTGLCKLVDFGLAEAGESLDRHAVPHPQSCTPNYASPEQANGRDQTARTDVWGLGGVLFFALTGEPLYLLPLKNGKFAEDVKAGRFDQKFLDSKNVDKGLKRICLRALAVNPDDRYPTALSMARALERFASRPMMMLGWSIAVFLLLVAVGISIFARHAVPPTVWPPDSFQIKVSGMQDLESGNAYIDPGSKFVVQATIPSGFYATLFDLSSDGQLSKLAQLQNSDTDRILTYPSGGATAQLTGDAGIDFVFVCIDRNKPLDVSDIQDAGVLTKLPSAQPHAVFKITTDGVQLIRASDSPSEKAKGIAPSTDATGNLGSVQDQLNNIRQSLSHRKIASFQGIAFSHAAGQ